MLNLHRLHLIKEQNYTSGCGMGYAEKEIEQ